MPDPFTLGWKTLVHQPGWGHPFQLYFRKGKWHSNFYNSYLIRVNYFYFFFKIRKSPFGFCRLSQKAVIIICCSVIL